MQCSASLLPLPLPPRQKQCVVWRYTSAVQQGHTKTLRSSVKSLLGGAPLGVGRGFEESKQVKQVCVVKGPPKECAQPSLSILWHPPPPLCCVITHTSSSADGPHSHWCFMFNSGSTQLNLEPPQLITAFHFYAKTRRCLFTAIPHVFTYLLIFITRQLP